MKFNKSILIIVSTISCVCLLLFWSINKVHQTEGAKDPVGYRVSASDQELANHLELPAEKKSSLRAFPYSHSGKASFKAYPATQLKRLKDNLLILEDPIYFKRNYSNGKVFHSSVINLDTSRTLGKKDFIDNTTSAITATLNTENVVSYLESDAEFLRIPLSRTRNIDFKVTEIVDRGEHTVSLGGRIKDSPLSNASFVFHDGAVSGVIELPVDQEKFDIAMLNEEEVVIRDIDIIEQQCTSGCQTCALMQEENQSAHLPALDKPSSAAVSKALNDNGVYIIDAVGTYDPSLENSFGGGAAGMEARMINGVVGINACLTNSRLTNVQVNLLAVAPEVEDVTLTGTDARFYYDGLQAIGSSRSTLLKQQLGADYDFIIYTGTNTGIASEIPDVTTTAYRTAPYYTSSGSASMTGASSTLVHEFGHLAGALHAWGDAGSSDRRYRHGWRMITPENNGLMTVMSYQNTRSSRRYSYIGYFSSPTQQVSNTTIGAVEGYDASGDASVDPDLVTAGGSRGNNVGSGYDGSNPGLGADNQRAILTYVDSFANKNERITLAMFTPNQGDVYIQGGNLGVSWTGADNTQTLTVDLMRSGELYTTIGTSLGHQMEIDYLIPLDTPSSNDYSVRISLSSGEILQSELFSIGSDTEGVRNINAVSYTSSTLEINLPESPVGQEYTYNILSQPTAGSLSGTPPNLVYTSQDGVHTQDSFDYSITSDGVTSEVRTVTVAVYPPVGYWPLDNGEGTVATDLSGADNHGRLVGNNNTAWHSGIRSGALELKGGLGLNLPTPYFTPTRNDFTLAFWVNVDPSMTFLTTLVRSTGGQMDVTHYGSRWTIWVGTQSLRGSILDVGLGTFGQWEHVVITLGGGRLSFYRNGQLVSSAPGGGVQMDEIIFHRPSGRYGQLDEVMLFDTAIGAEHITNLYNSYSDDLAKLTIAATVAGDGTGYDITGDEVISYRSTAISKTLDPDEDHVYGTAGSYFIGNNANNSSNTDNTPSWISNVATTGSPVVLSGYLDFDDPTAAVASNVADWTSTGIITNRNNTPGDWEPLMSFTVTSAAPSKFRLGVISGLEGNNDGRWDPSGIRVITDNGVSEVTNLEITNLGMVFFDVSVPPGASGLVSIEGQTRDVGGNSRGPTLTGILFDEFPPTALDNWLASYGLENDDLSLSSHDSDGIPNMIEYVLNGDPTENDHVSIMPVITDGVYQFTRRIESTEDTLQYLEYSYDLNEWHQLSISGGQLDFGVSITPGSDSELEMVSVDMSPMVDEDKRLFIRLKVEKN